MDDGQDEWADTRGDDRVTDDNDRLKVLIEIGSKNLRTPQPGLKSQNK